MSTYQAPLREMLFTMKEIGGLDAVCALPGHEETTPDLVEAILEEAGKFAAGVLDPINYPGDQQGARWQAGVVTAADGFRQAYASFCETGWNAMPARTEFGGQGLPTLVSTAVLEMWKSANMAFSLCQMLTLGAVEAIAHHGSAVLKQRFLPKMVAGEWTGTMNLTEPQAGSDVGALSSKAEPNGDGTYAVTGQKIFISWGDNDFCDNVCHLVLARLPDGVPGTKGISLFLVPRNLPDENGNAGVANSLKVVSLEHKMGLHGSPTCVMQYDGATGWLVGEEHGGMAAMFTMMNNARLGVGGQGVGVAEAAWQHAMAYAMERKQGKSASGTIADHADVRRMLTSMKADVFAARAILAACAVAIDMGNATGSAEWKARAAFLTPIAKAFGTDTGIAVSETGVQVHGGMGFIEETGAAQFYRDVRVTAIYEGTNGIQAMDLVARKMMDGGEAAAKLLDEIEDHAERARGRLPELAGPVWEATETLREATEWMVAQGELNDRFAGAVPFLRAFARVLGGHFHLIAALADPGGPREKLARYYINALLPEHAGLLEQAQGGCADLYAISLEELSA